MQPFQERVVAERKELDEKIAKLESFIGSVVFYDLPEAEQSRLEAQAAAMNQYSDILKERIDAFG